MLILTQSQVDKIINEANSDNFLHTDLETIFPTTYYSGKISNLVNEYFDDPNCRPELWISSENLTQQEKIAFIFHVKNHENYKD